jgi:hypothetical protein
MGKTEMAEVVSFVLDAHGESFSSLFPNLITEVDSWHHHFLGFARLFLTNGFLLRTSFLQLWIAIWQP